MNTLNIKLYETLYDWDPFQIGSGNYDPEIADIIQAVNEIDTLTLLAKRIQDIFEFSFEKQPPAKECMEIANTLLTLKNEDSCSV